MTDLLGCPFCGSSNSTICANSVTCEDCGGKVILDWSPGDDGEKAIAAWNRRSPAPEHGGREGWRAVADGLPEPDEWVWAIRGKIPFVAAWDEEEGWYTFNRYYERDKVLPQKFEPTHWQPLPDPPSVLSASLGGGEGSSVASRSLPSVAGQRRGPLEKED